jgi:hypothetical protein
MADRPPANKLNLFIARQLYLPRKRIFNKLMSMPLLKKQHLLAVSAIAVLSCFNAFSAAAQANPYSLSGNTSSHLSFSSAVGAANRLNARWARYNMALAAAGGKDVMFRSELSGGIILTSASIEFALRTSNNNEITHDTSLKFTGRPAEKGYHVAWASGYPLATLSDDAAVILTYGVSYDNLKWAMPKMTIEGRETQFDFFSNTIGIPLYLDYKWGAEALLDISKHICLTAGAGAVPAYTLTVGDNKGNDGRFTVRPSARVEAGLATKFISFKVQATALMGNVAFLNKHDLSRDIDYFGGIAEDYDIRVQGHNQFILSLVLMTTTTSWQYKPWFR